MKSSDSEQRSEPLTLLFNAETFDPERAAKAIHILGNLAGMELAVCPAHKKLRLTRR